MKYTFATAKRVLSHNVSGRAIDVGDAINVALETLCTSQNWLDQKRIVRLTTVDEYIALPQEFSGIVRAAINGVPVSMRRSDYEFLHSGPGDLDYIPAGYSRCSGSSLGIQDLGTHATMYDTEVPMTICAFSTAVPTGPIRIRGRDENGDFVTTTVAINSWAGVDDLGSQDPDAVTATSVVFGNISELILPADTEAYVSIYGIADSEFYFLSRMHPAEKAAEFRRYRVPVASGLATGESLHILAEVRMRFTPLVDDDDLIPFDSLLPIQYMLQSLWYNETNEVEQAQKYRALAETHLGRTEETKHTQQGFDIINTLYDESPGGQANYDYYNL